MRRHETDWLSLSIGGLYVVVAAVHIGTEGTGSSGHSLRWFIPATLLVLGVLGLIGATTRSRTPAVAPAYGPYPTPRPARTGDTSTVDTSRVDTPTDDTPTVDTPTGEQHEDADQPDVVHTTRLDDEQTVRLDGGSDGSVSASDESGSDPSGSGDDGGDSDDHGDGAAADRPAEPGKPPADG